jgi:opacity protein-like surface antigen
MKSIVMAAIVCAALALPRSAAAADQWDIFGGAAGHIDDGNFTDNELANGSEQAHDLEAIGGTADEDWYLVGQQPYSSYEVVVDGLTEEVAYIPASTVGQALQVDLVDSGGTLLNTGYAFSSIGAARTLRFRNTGGAEVTNQYIRIMSGPSGCTTGCSSSADYRVHFFETTYLIPRFNNSGTQTTVLILQNGANESVAATARFWDTGGALLASQSISLNAHGTAVINTAGIAGAAGAAGSITIDHTGRYGSLHGKAVALEPSTGFTFDTMMTPRF